MSIEEYFGDWSNIVDLKEADRVVQHLSASKISICPLIKDVFKAFTLCSFHNLKVVILGQDPYSDIYKGNPRATGIAFANSPDTPEESYSPSLDVLRESVIDYTIPHGITNFDPSLEKWEEQGVLLLNSALTCEVEKPGSHSLMWRPFIATLLTNLSKCDAGVIYVLMGNQAQSFEPFIHPKTNYIIKIKHPAWYARNKVKLPSDTWREINRILQGQSNSKIDWFTEY